MTQALSNFVKSERSIKTIFRSIVLNEISVLIKILYREMSSNVQQSIMILIVNTIIFNYDLSSSMMITKN